MRVGQVDPRRLECGRVIITLTIALPCAQLRGREAGQCSPRICGAPAVVGVISPLEDGIWELLPVCQDHLDEAAAEWERADSQPLIPKPLHHPDHTVACR